MAAVERLAQSPEVFTSMLSDVVEIFEPPARVPLVRKFQSSQVGSLEQALKRLHVTPAFISTLGPIQSLSQERMWELMLEWSTRPDSEGAASSGDLFEIALATVIASAQVSTIGAGDSRAYNVKSDLDSSEVTSLRSSVLAAFSSSELSARIKKYHDLARAQNYEVMQELYSSEADPDIRMIFDTPTEQFASVVTSSCKA